MSLTIKTAEATQVTLIRQMAEATWPQTYLPIIGAEQIAYMLNKFYTVEVLAGQMEDGHRFIICYDNEVPVAFAGWSEVAPKVYKLHKLYILPDQQGKGIGRYILDHITNELKKESADSLRLNVNRYNSNAIAFYEKAGFRHLFDEDIDIGSGYFMNDHVLGIEIA